MQRLQKAHCPGRASHFLQKLPEHGHGQTMPVTHRQRSQNKADVHLRDVIGHK